MNETLADPIDRAWHSQSLIEQGQIAKQQAKAAPLQVRRPDGTWPQPECVSCGEDIDERRLEAVGAITCTHCAELKEREDKRHGRT